MDRRSGGQASYRELYRLAGVAVRVSTHMRWCEPHEFMAQTPDGGQAQIAVPGHWRNSVPLPGVFINRHFFGFKQSDLGRQVAAEVLVMEKSFPDGRHFVHLDILKMAGGVARFAMKISDNDKYPDAIKKIPVGGSCYKIFFVPWQ